MPDTTINGGESEPGYLGSDSLGTASGASR